MRWAAGSRSTSVPSTCCARSAPTRSAPAAALNWERPFTGALGDLWKITLHRRRGRLHRARASTSSPISRPVGSTETARAQPTAALMVRWPFVRDAGEPGHAADRADRADRRSAPTRAHRERTNTSRTRTASTSSSPTRTCSRSTAIPGIDRLEGGLRAQCRRCTPTGAGAAATFDGLVGQSYRAHKDDTFPVASGLERQRLRHRGAGHDRAGELARPHLPLPARQGQSQRAFRRGRGHGRARRSSA